MSLKDEAKVAAGWQQISLRGLMGKLAMQLVRFGIQIALVS